MKKVIQLIGAVVFLLASFGAFAQQISEFDLEWAQPTEYESGTALQPGDIVTQEVVYRGGAVTEWTVLETITDGSTSASVVVPSPPSTVEFAVRTWTSNGASSLSDPLEVSTWAPKPATGLAIVTP